MSQLQRLSRLSGRRLSVSVEMNALMSDRTNDQRYVGDRIYIQLWLLFGHDLVPKNSYNCP
ncbi:hypothetical protein PC116_g32245 [Phytophthora cactorum]|nr:hypothetical protein PC116_g32245 [Phytophthora cactorum]